ncbi:PRC-barrel domain-containing protein [Alkaliphilus hydrothermalis]|uniref:Sporulation protein YlmC with PRC-barrel domain n=1 Tax=Alkaliphilus hydrothermalis TaxID=1482730 RepID=A0ABS2NQ46_9FIRM|nr:PRC-barrel domain-containing protein [Alkaliphilus hydrothermalis]MBM7615067.1 sporulation protein YlmC with PRC-barrel domain [Alkaliphilus hydrothermalis]
MTVTESTKKFIGAEKATNLIGFPVYSREKEAVGKIEDILIDCNNGYVTFAILSFGGFLGFGGKLFAIPWKSLEVDLVDKQVVVDISKEKLETSPGFNEDPYLNVHQSDFRESIYKHYSVDPYWHHDRYIK